MKTTLLAFALLAGASLAPSQYALAASLPWTPRGAALHVPGEVLVKFGPSATVQSRRAAIASRAHSEIADLPAGWVRVRLRVGEIVDAALSTYRADPAVEYAQPNFIYRATAVPNDPQYGQQWALKNTGQTSTSVLQPGAFRYAIDNPGIAGDDVNVEKGWGQITDCSSVVVAVVDSGVNYNHADLAANMWNGAPTYPSHGYDFVDGDDDPMDLLGHGTHVAGVIGAVGNNAIGTTGVCWSASIMAVRVLDASGFGTTASIIQGVHFAVDRGAKVINMSLGGSGFDKLYSDSITYAANAGVVVVVAAGNDGLNNDTTPVYPCNFTQTNLICVAALDQSYQLATFSNYGSVSVDVGAPGTNILSTWNGTGVSVPTAPASGWTLTSTTGAGWGFATNGTSTFLVDPTNYSHALYNANTDDRAYKSVPISATSTVVGRFIAAIDVRSGDHFRIGCSSAGGDPFVAGTVLGDISGIATNPVLVAVAGEVTPDCSGASSTFGFQLRSAAGSPGDKGLAITGLTFTTLNATSYNTDNGTSMATPMVAGVATMLRAYNPQYAPADVVSAIVNGGRPVASLAGKTTSGKSVDAIGSLAYIHPPTGLAAAIH